MRFFEHQNIGLQGNIDPRILFAGKQDIENELDKYISFGEKEHKWIFNLGHGFLPGISYENAKYLTDWVKTTNWRRQ